MDIAERKTFTVKDMKAVAFGDRHSPFHCTNSIKKVLGIIAVEKPNVVVDEGDADDCYMFSRFPQSHNLLTPKQELVKARRFHLWLWGEINKIVPKALKIQLRGNHEHRVIKTLRASKDSAVFESLLDDNVNNLTTAPGVIDMKSHRSEVMINGIIFVHGWNTLLGYHANYFGRSVVSGHSHRGGCSVVKTRDKVLFELNCGHTCNPKLLPFQYGEAVTNKWVKGLGMIDKYGPRFIPL